MNTKLSKEDVAAIRRSKLPDQKIADFFNVSRLTVLRARTGQTHREVKKRPVLRKKSRKGIIAFVRNRGLARKQTGGVSERTFKRYVAKFFS